MPRLFLEWVAEHMTQKHTVFNQDTCVHVELGEKLALAILEVVFLGRPSCPDDEKYRGECLQGLFHIPEAGEAAAGEPEPSVDEADLRRERLARLKQRLLSPAVQVPEVDGLTEVPDKLSAEEVAQVFKDHVPGVEKLLYRQQRGNFSIKFIQSAYSEGFRAFSGSDMHQHLLWLMRLIVHHGHENKPGAATYLREVAEAFTDCQAVQGRTVERIGLQIRGVALDFRGHLVRLAGEYKAMAVKILAVEECTKRGGPDDYHDPPHMESRIIRDLGSGFGLNSSHIKQAMADTHAESRFPKLVKAKRQAAETRLRALFDTDAWLKAFAAEASTLSAGSERESLPRLFLDWASEHMTEKHILLDSDTCSRVEVGDALALAVAEVVFLGRAGCCRGEEYRGTDIQDLFVPNEELVAKVARAEASKGLVESVAQEDGENEENCASDEESNEEPEEESGEESGEESD
uniref:Uncharacterized protein n=1 Tax=Alexandrium catenella TaxID=2925 RepID=A0A7S1RHY9_ALECA